MEKKKVKIRYKFNKISNAYFFIMFCIVAIYVLFFGDDNVFKYFGIIEPTKENTISVLNVGQGCSILISSNGQFCLIDAGQTDEGQDNIVEYLKSKGVKELELLVITHFHFDHISEVVNVLDNFEVRDVLIPNLAEKNIPEEDVYDILIEREENGEFNLYNAMKGDIFTIGDGILTVLDNTYNDLEINNTSIATLFKQGTFTFLNTGDGEAPYEKRLLREFTRNVTLFSGGHHGASNANTEEFLKVISPDFVAVSVGEYSEYGHPNKEAVENYEKYAGQYNITSRDGTLVYSMDTKELIEN